MGRGSNVWGAGQQCGGAGQQCGGVGQQCVGGAAMLRGGTAMCGGWDSSVGVDSNIYISNCKFELPKSMAHIHGVCSSCTCTPYTCPTRMHIHTLTFCMHQ